MSRKKADDVAETILQPSEEKLTRRKQTVEQRQSRFPAPFWSLVPAVTAATVTGLAVSFLGLPSIVYAVVLGAVFGWVVGSLLKRPS